MLQNTKIFPEITGNEKQLTQSSLNTKDAYLAYSNINFDSIKSAFGLALHMHQPTIPASSDNIRTAGLIGNLQYMLENQGVGDNHNAAVFLKCYSRMSDIIRDLARNGKNPRIMLDYSGNLLWALAQMGQQQVLENLKLITCDEMYYTNTEWLGTMWSHAVVSSTPIPDIKLHIQAWRYHFASIFGQKAMERVRGFSPPEMHLPIHPDVCFEYVKALNECGYKWLMVQEHTIENLDGSGIRMPHLPHKLVAKNSLGQTQEITVLIKTQGSDTKLVAQMQPFYEAKTLSRQDCCGKNIPPFVLQIGDGENGGVMMNEFPPAYIKAFNEMGSDTVAMNGSEYLEFLRKKGIKEKDFAPVMPVTQNRIWEFCKNFKQGAADKAIEQAKQKYGSFNLDKASWTSDKNWVKGYEDVLDPVNKLSAAFHNRFDDKEKSSELYKNSLLYLLLSQTSCFRYWGQGIWTEYAKEICRRGMELLKQ